LGEPVPLDPRITLQKLVVFEHVVELESVTRAAERLYVAQPVVTAHIRSLEERLGAKLFYREGRRMLLTEAGRAVHAWASEVLRRTRELDRHLESVSDGRQGTIVLGSSMGVGGYLLPPVLSAFKVERPGVDIRLNILDTEHAIADTLSGENDFAVVVSEASPATESLEAELLGVEELVFVCAPEFEAADATLTIEQLAGLPFVEAPTGLIRRSFVENQLNRVGIHDRKIVIEMGHPEAMKQATRAGLGVAVLSYTSVARELERGELRRIHVDGVEELGFPAYLVHRKDKLLTVVHLDLIARIRAFFAGRRAGGGRGAVRGPRAPSDVSMGERGFEPL
jgi:DNA-binding transcriptional LysR family regulator